MSESREELEQRIAAYIDGELPPAEAARLEVFLANTDPQLANQVIGMLADKHRLRALPGVKAPPDLAGHIMEQVERASLLHDSEHFASPKRPWYQNRAAIAAAIFLVVGGFSYFLITSVLTQESPWRSPLAKNDAGSSLAPVPMPAAGAPAPAAASAPDDGAIALAPTTPATPAVPEASHEEKALSMKSGGEFGVGGGGAGGRGGGAFSEENRVMGKSAIDAGGNTSGSAPSIAQNPNSLPVQTASRAIAQSASTADADDQVQTALARASQLMDSPADAPKLGYIEADPAKALDALTASATQEKLAAQPIVLTFVARNADDTGRLQSRLQELIAADPVEVRKQTVLQTDYRRSETAVSNVSSKTGPTDTPPPAYRFYDKDARAFDKDVLENTNTPPTPINGGGTNNANDENGAHNIAQNAAPANLDQQQTAPQQQVAPQQPQASVASPTAAPYRVALRPDQLQALCNEFNLRTASRGGTAYAITPAPAQTTAAPAAEENAAPPPSAEARQQQTIAASQPATTNRANSQNWIDCVITIEPAK